MADLTDTSLENDVETHQNRYIPKLAEDTGKISGRQFMFVIISYIQSAILCATFMVKYLDKNDNYWFFQIGSFLLYIPMMLIFYCYMRTYPNKNLVEINEYVFGPVMGKIVSIGYLCFYILSGSVHLNEVSDFISKFMLPKMSMIIIAFLVMIIAAWVAFTGVKVFTKLSSLIVVFLFLIIIFLLFFSRSFANLKNFLPFTSEHPRAYVKGVSVGSMLNYGEVFMFLMIAPKVSRKKDPVNKKHVFGGFITGGLTLIILGIINTAVLGNMMNYFTFPSFEVMRIVSVWDSVSRFEIVFVMAIILLTLSRLALVVYSVTKGISEVAKIDDYRHLVLVTGALILTFTLSITKRYLGSISLENNFSFLPWFIFGIGFPLLTFICSIIKLKGIPSPEINFKKDAPSENGGKA